MGERLASKAAETVRRLRDIWRMTDRRRRFVAFSTGKDSLALAALLYEAVAPERPVCLYAHHRLEMPGNLGYVHLLRRHGFNIQIVKPHLEYFELMERGMGFLTRHQAWCIPMLIGTGLLDWTRRHGAHSPRDAVMFRGMSGGEYSRKWHGFLESYKVLDTPCFNPLLDYTTGEVLELLRSRYRLPLNPVYEHLDRTSCICCYSANAKRKAFSERHFPDVCRRYYGQIEALLFDTGLIEKSPAEAEHRTREEMLSRQRFAGWCRNKAQDVVGAIKRRLQGGGLAYALRDPAWFSPKHLSPVSGRWTRVGNEIRFWDVSERAADVLIRRMINCLDCGFCMVECFSCRQFDPQTKSLRISGCTQCGRCLRLKHCMGWKHRFWRRIIREDTDGRAKREHNGDAVPPR